MFSVGAGLLTGPPMSSSRRRGQNTAAAQPEPTDSIVECPLYPALLPERVCTLPSSQCICRLYVQQLQTIHGRRWRTRMSFHALHIAYFSLYSGYFSYIVHKCTLYIRQYAHAMPSVVHM
jgi:hypothetical protein